MKILKPLTLAAMFAITSTAAIQYTHRASAQPTQATTADDDNPCRLILQNGLYKTYNMTKSGSFSQDFKTYLETETFRNDFKNGKWQGDIAAVINGTPAKLGLGASDEQINQFQERIKSSTSFSVDQSFYEYARIAVPDVELARAYSDCIKNLPPKVGFYIVPNINEKDAYFVVTYKKFSSGDPMPKVTLFQAKNGTNVVKSFSENDFLQDSNTISMDRDPNKDLTLILETDKGAVTYRVPAEPAGYNKDFPVGTVIASYLNWSQFQGITMNNQSNPDNSGFWSSKYSKWAPADGREVPNSALARASSQGRVPDLRGVFVRGLNQIDPESQVAADPARSDSDSRVVGSYQEDNIKTHSHTYGRWEKRIGVKPGTEYPDILATDGDPDDRKTQKRETIGGPTATETRPKNVALYYYIRIN